MAGKSRSKFSRQKTEVGVSTIVRLLVSVEQLNDITGLRCPRTLKKGQFIDTYRGEIITNDEANQRGKLRKVDQNNYLMDFDKFTQRMISEDEIKEILAPEEYERICKAVKKGEYEVEVDEEGNQMWLNPQYKPPYVCDSMYMGGPTRFMNHSCAPNCRLFTASYNHADRDVYEIAFFAIQEISADTELTFDYKDEDDRGVITDEMADILERDQGYRPMLCLCGSGACRRYFFN